MYRWLGIVASLTVWSTLAQDYPPSKPFLRIETGMHTAEIVRMDTDAAGQFIVTASLDKTARVWDARDGKPVQVLRPPQGDGNEGKLYAVAMSPDGETVAVGGWTGSLGRFSVYFFRRQTGKLIAHLDGFPAVIAHLSYSRDGRFLVVALGGTSGIRIYRTSDLRETVRDTDYGDIVYWAEFDRAGRLITSARDQFLRLYGSDFELIRKVQPLPGKEPLSCRFSPDGSKIAVGFADSPGVQVLGGRELELLYSPDAARGKNRDYGSIAWSADGEILYAAGRSFSDGPFFALSWKGGGKEPSQTWPLANSTIHDLRSLALGRFAFASAEPTVGVLDSRGERVWDSRPGLEDFRGFKAFRSSASGQIVEFEFGVSDRPGNWRLQTARFDVSTRQLLLDPKEDDSLSAPRTSGLDIANWGGLPAPTLNGRPLPIDRYDISRSLAIAADAKSFILGTDWGLHSFNAKGERRWVVPVPGNPWNVNFARDGSYALAALADGTIRWYTADSGEEVLALFVHRDGKRWVAWTPDGFFASSPGGESLIGYHLNHGNDHEGEFIKVDQLQKLYYRPDLISRSLTLEGRLEIRAQLRIEIAKVVSANNSPPNIELLSPAETDSEGEYELKFRITNQGGGIGRIVYQIDGAEIDGRAVAIAGLGPSAYSTKIPLPPGRHQLVAKVYNGKNEVESRSITATVNVRQPTGRPDLYVIAAGVSTYRDHALQQGVRYAAADAEELVRHLKQQGASLFGTVNATALTNADATRANIEATFSAIAAKMKPADVFVFYLAGHGMAIDGGYNFIPWEVPFTSLEALKEKSLNQDAIQALLKKVTASKVLLLLDTCSSGAFIGRDPIAASDKGAIDRLAKLSGRAILAATAADKMALEGYQNHGVFTYALLEGLEKAFDSQGLIQITALADFVERRVPEITKERWNYEEFPMKELKGQTFPIARKP